MSKTTILKVGFIGLGDQGGPMAHAIAESGFELHVWARRHQSLLQQLGITYLDAPVSGGRQGALARTLTTMVGGESQAFSRVRAVFETFSRKVSLLRPSGTGQMAMRSYS
ncbi:NAD(P)-binding domain-containing protein [Pseudomonas sp. NPDC087639]|uniref:NAD(P)-binding domain-containing protein n=1 Tax=Pseudomonas sp. NPDC087639 TaxID=3364445 RepID=UPI00381BBDA9